MDSGDEELFEAARASDPYRWAVRELESLRGDDDQGDTEGFKTLAGAAWEQQAWAWMEGQDHTPAGREDMSSEEWKQHLFTMAASVSDDDADPRARREAAQTLLLHHDDDWVDPR